MSKKCPVAPQVRHLIRLADGLDVPREVDISKARTRMAPGKHIAARNAA